MTNSDPPRIVIAQEAAKSVLRGLNMYDWTNVIFFDSEAHAYSDKLIRSTDE